MWGNRLEQTDWRLLHTLGELRLEGADQALSSRRKELTLLAFIARRAPRWCTRDELSSLLWEDRDRSRARQSLRQTLLELKRVLGDALLTDGEEVSVDPARIRLDVSVVEKDLESGRLAEGIEGWRGEFLAGMEDVGGEAFRGWLEGERASLRTRVRAAFVRLTGDTAASGAWSEAVGWTERWTAAFPLDEEAHRQLAEALNLSGRQAAAMSRLAAYSARVQVELGIAPSPSILALRASLERSMPASRRSPALGSAALFTPDIVGREPALAELAAAWAEAKSGAVVVVVVEAESGMGRTRLVEAFGRRARQSGDAVVCRVKGRRAGDPEPWAGLRELLDGLVSAPGAAGAGPDALAALAALAPALKARFLSLPPLRDAGTGAETALAEVLGAVVEEHRLLVLLDDITRIDAASFDVIVGAVARQSPRMLLLATAATDDPAASAAVDHLRTVGPIRRLKLPPLGVADLEALLESMLQLSSADRRQLAERLHAEGGGSPFYAVEMTSALVDERLLVATEDGGWRLAAGGDWSFPRPASIREALTRRLLRLPAHAREVAEAAAAMGGPRDRRALQRKSGLGATAFDVALEELVAAKLMRGSPSDGGYDFSQDVTAGIVSDMMSPARRTALLGTGDSPARRTVWLAGAAAVLTVGAVFATLRARDAPSLDRHLALAAPLRNETGNAALDPIGDLAADWITQGIAQSGVLHVVSPQALRASIRTVKAEAPASDQESRLEALARETGAGTVIGGSYYRTGDSLTFQLRITDATSGRVLSAPEPIHGSAADPSRALDQLRERAVAALGLLFNARLGGMSQNASRPPPYAAYKEFVQGLDLHVRYRYQEALAHYQRARALDSTFGSPVVWSALAYWSVEDYPGTDSMLRLAERLGDHLSPFDALLAANQRGELHGNYAAALAAAQEMTRVSSGSEAFILVGQESLRLNRPRQAVDAFRRADPDRGWIKGWEGYWGFLARAYHQTGDLESALHSAREGRRRYPSSLYSLTYEATELAALGRTAELNATLFETESRPVEAGWPPAVAMLAAAGEFRAHGHSDEARQMAVRGLKSLRSLPGPATDFTRSLEIRLAYEMEAWDTVARLAKAIPDGAGGLPEREGYLGVLAARRGDTAEAAQRSASLAQVNEPYGFGKATIWRARIAALLDRKEEAVQLIRTGFSEGARRDELSHDWDLTGLRGFGPFDEVLRPAE